jgi:ABC-type multidrug transport system fused ATPase/permease subunit
VKKQPISQEVIRLRKEIQKTFFSKNALMLIITVIIMILLALFNLAVSYLLQVIIDIIAEGNIKGLIEIGWWSLGIFVLFVIVFLVQRVTFSGFMRRAVMQYKNFAFSQIMKKSVQYISGDNSAKYISMLTNDVLSIEKNYVSKIFALIMESVTFVGAIIMMIYYSPLLTVAALALSSLPIVASFLSGNKLAQSEKIVAEKNEGFVEVIKEMLSGFSVIKSFKAEKEISGLFREKNSEIESAKYDRRMTEELINLLSEGAGIIAQIGIFLFGAFLAITGDQITPGIVIVFMQLMYYVTSPIGTVPPILANRKASIGLMNRLAEAVHEEIPQGGKTIDKELNKGIRIQNLSFSHDGTERTLEDITLKFERGKRYAIVGRSGCGKSTLLNLLMRGYDKYDGQIFFDDDELQTISLDSLYDLTSIIQQNVFIFNSTIMDNITMFREFDREKVQRAVDVAGLSDLIRERGVDTICGENGINLSGGERQRISIARCILRGTPVMLVDEATAALDSVTSSAVLSSILNIEGITEIVVTHYLDESLLKRFDDIIVMSAGRIVEVGKFDELIRKQGLFSSLLKLSEEMDL